VNTLPGPYPGEALGVKPLTLPPPFGVVNISGAELACRLPHLSAYDRSLLAYEIASGELVFHKPTKSQIARLLGVTERSIAAVARSARGHAPRKLSDAALARLIARVGPQRIFDALDRATAPTATAAE
jgi:hypothetical protein